MTNKSKGKKKALFESQQVNSNDLNIIKEEGQESKYLDKNKMNWRQAMKDALIVDPDRKVTPEILLNRFNPLPSEKILKKMDSFFDSSQLNICSAKSMKFGNEGLHDEIGVLMDLCASRDIKLEDKILIRKKISRILIQSHSAPSLKSKWGHICQFVMSENPIKERIIERFHTTKDVNIKKRIKSKKIRRRQKFSSNHITQIRSHLHHFLIQKTSAKIKSKPEQLSSSSSSRKGPIIDIRKEGLADDQPKTNIKVRTSKHLPEISESSLSESEEARSPTVFTMEEVTPKLKHGVSLDGDYKHK